MSSYLLTKEQKDFRDKRLVENLIFNYPHIGNYPHDKIVEAYNIWFAATEDNNEDDFLSVLDELMTDGEYE